MSRNKILILIIALLTVVAQLFVPISMARHYEDVLQTGESYLFKVMPIDPADPFRGRFVVLDFPVSRGNILKLENPEIVKALPRNSSAYAILVEDNAGFAKIGDIQLQAPSNQNYIKIKNRYSYDEKYSIELPFDRYYAEESKAPEIESLLWNQERDQNREFYADVRIKDGYGVIAELYVEKTPILEYLEQRSNNK